MQYTGYTTGYMRVKSENLESAANTMENFIQSLEMAAAALGIQLQLNLDEISDENNNAYY